MKKIFSLSKVMIKNSFDNLTVSKTTKSKPKRIITVLGFILLYVYLAVVIYFMSKDVLLGFNFSDDSQIILDIIFQGVIVYTFIVAILSVPSIFYFSKDIEHLLALPLKSIEIIIAKTLTAYLALLASLSFILIPFALAYQIIIKPDFSFLLFYTLAAFVLPILPLALIILIIILLFTFIPKVNNKDMFSYLTTILMIIIILFTNSQSFTNDNMLNNLANSNFSSLLSKLIITLPILTKAIYNKSILMINLGLLISFFLIAIVIVLTSPLYFKGAIAMSESSSKKIRHKKIKNNQKLNTRLTSLIINDVKNIYKTPIFMINYLMPVLLFPILFLIPMLSEIFNAGLSIDLLFMYLDEARYFLSLYKVKFLLPYVIIVSYILTMFFGATSTISSTAISREGERMSLFKSLPIKMMLVIKAKLIIGSVVSVFVPIVFLTILTILFRPSIILIIVSLITIILTAVFANSFNLVFDVFKPKLVWDNETQAVKQNFIAVIPMFLAIILIGLSIYAFIVYIEYRVLMSVLILVSLLGLSLFIYNIIIKKYGLKSLDAAIEKL